MHRLAVLEKELLQDHLGKKGGSSGGNRSGAMSIAVSLGTWRVGAMVGG